MTPRSTTRTFRVVLTLRDVYVLELAATDEAAALRQARRVYDAHGEAGFDRLPMEGGADFEAEPLTEGEGR